jgi:hypothetical protein
LKGSFALTPDDGPSRILRFVEPDRMPTGDARTLCVLDDETNVLTINKVLYEKLTDMQRHQIQRTHALTIAIDDRRLAA